MQYRLKHRLGQFDARKCNADYHASLPLEADKLARGCTIELPDAAFNYLTKKLGHVALLEPVDQQAKVKAVAKDPAIGASK